MSTPPATKNKAKHPAVRALEGQLLPGDSVPVDILTATPDGCLDVSSRIHLCLNYTGGKVLFVSVDQWCFPRQMYGCVTPTGDLLSSHTGINILSRSWLNSLVHNLHVTGIFALLLDLDIVVLKCC